MAAPSDGREAPDAPPAALPRRVPAFARWGRLLLTLAAIAAALSLWHEVAELPRALEALRRLAALAALIMLGWLAGAVLVRQRGRVLWRVRLKLVLSYVFLGFVPLVLVLAFVLTGGLFLYTTVVGYVVNEGIADIVDDARQVAQTTASELGRTAIDAQASVDRRRDNLSEQYPGLGIEVWSIAGGRASRLALAGPWVHGAPDTLPPGAMAGRAFAGLIIVDDPSGPGGFRLIARAAVPTINGRRLALVDLPIDEAITERLRARTGTRPLAMSATGCGVDGDTPELERSVWRVFREAIVYMDCTRWTDGAVGTLAVQVDAPLSAVSTHLASVRSAVVAATVGGSLWQVFRTLLVVLGVLFLIIQASALVLGGLLARSITSAVHELFIGTERVRQGDFTHRIPIESPDQLGALAQSFNRMSESIGTLMQVQREKQRLDEELRIAREIQKSLLPVQHPRLAGVDIADLCEPAREVGGDYYDFFVLGPGQIGVLIADVAGKGTSAALYMAELKGLMLALSHVERSPRRLLMTLNRHLSEHLDNRSFITMTYAVLDLARGTLTCARAGHTPLIVVSGGQSELVIPDGMVLGLRFPGSIEKFDAVLEEHTRAIAPGDVIVLHTDGVTEAMNTNGELFGDEALARILTHQQHLDAAGIRERVVRDVAAFVGAAEPHDDMTLVIIKVGTEGADA